MVADPRELPDDAGFDLVRRGYDQSQVDAHMRRLDAEIKILHTDRAAAVAQTAAMTRELEAARARAERLRSHVQHISDQPQSAQGMSERMRSMLRLAEDEVADMLARAEAQADARIREADLEARRLVDAAQIDADAVRSAAQAEIDESVAGHRQARAELDEQRQTAVAAHSAATAELTADRDRLRAEIAELRREADAEISRARAELAADQLRIRSALDAERTSSVAAIAAANAEAEQLRTATWAESEQRRAQIEDDFAIAMNQRRNEAIAALGSQVADARREAAQLRETAAAEADRTLANARARADEIVGEARAAIEELTTTRHRLVQQLGGVRGELDRLVERMGPLPDEQPAEFPTPSSSPEALAPETRAPEQPAEEPAPPAARRPSPNRRNRRPHPAHR